jgi:bleomycin hydrolase
MDKKDRIEMCESLMTHAMVFDGYHSNASGDVDYWLIENSWGTDTPYKGHLVCSDSWFREYTYQLVVPKSYLNENETLVWDSNEFSKRFPLWDPMGSLAK